MKVVVLFKDGFEELEALSPVDVLRRANIEVNMIGMDKDYQVSSHGIKIHMDQEFDNRVHNADAVILPGGMPGAAKLRDDFRVINLLKEFNEQGKLICAICAGPISLEKADVLKGRKYTCYPGFEKEIPSGNYQDVLVCRDENIITARGPAAALKFGYTILEALGVDSKNIETGMQYPYLYK